MPSSLSPDHQVPPDRPVLIAGPTASGKSALALAIAERDGGVIVNADALQVYGCWREITARPTPQEEARAPHRLYGHLAHDAPYSVGHWLRDVTPILRGAERPIIIGGTGLYFMALTEGLSAVPEVPSEVRTEADAMELAALLEGIDVASRETLDPANRARVQRAWEVQHATGRPLRDWQAETRPPLLPLADAHALHVAPERDWLRDRIAQRFSAMINGGALEEVRAMAPLYDPALPAFRAIGVPELMAHLAGEMSLKEATDRAIIASQQYAKRQRTWFRVRMRDWLRVEPQISAD